MTLIIGLLIWKLWNTHQCILKLHIQNGCSGVSASATVSINDFANVMEIHSTTLSASGTGPFTNDSVSTTQFLRFLTMLVQEKNYIFR